MLAKTLTIRNEVYKRLTAVKRRDESFSQLFERLLDGSNSLELLTKLRGSAELRDKKKMLAEIGAARSERRL